MIFFKMVYIFFSTTHIFFLYQFQKHIFFKKTNKTFVFSIFSFFIQSTSSYFEKETEWKTLFLSFFKNLNTFFDKSERIFRILMTVMKFINTKTGKPFFFKFSYRKPQHACIYFIMNLQKEIREQRCLFPCPKFG